MKRKNKIKISNPFRFLTFLLVSLVTTSTCVTQAVKLFATNEKEEIQVEESEETTPTTDITVSVPREAKANDELYKTTQTSMEGVVLNETDLKNVGALVEDKLLIKLENIEWFEDEEKTSKQGLGIFLDLKNVTDEEMVVGRYVGDLIKPTLNYGEHTLKAYSQGMDNIVANAYGFTTLISNFQNYKLVQTGKFADVKTCDASITLPAGESDRCYLIYDYAGIGDYNLSFRVNDNTQAYGVFKIEEELISEEESSNQ